MKHRRNKNKRALSLSFMALFVGMIDLMTNAAATGLLMAAVAVPHINPPPKNIAEKKVSVATTALYAQLRWPANLQHDIDIWPLCWQVVNGEKRNITGVSYQHPLQNWLGLDKDDLGRPSVINLEEVKSNSEVLVVPPNSRCVFNVHLYHSHGGNMPVGGNLVVIANKDGDEEKVLAVVDFILNKPGEEITILYVEWDHKSQVISETKKIYPDAKFEPIVPVWKPQR